MMISRSSLVRLAGLANLQARLAIAGPRLVHSRIGETSVFVQSGKKISELPVVVKKVQNVFELYKRLGIKAELVEDFNKESSTSSMDNKMNEEEREVIDGFNRCVNSSSIFRLLETIPPEEGESSIESRRSYLCNIMSQTIKVKTKT